MNALKLIVRLMAIRYVKFLSQNMTEHQDHELLSMKLDQLMTKLTRNYTTKIKL